MKQLTSRRPGNLQVQIAAVHAQMIYMTVSKLHVILWSHSLLGTARVHSLIEDLVYS